MATVTFATICWERDWEQVLKKEGYLAEKQIGNHLYPFVKRTLIINNVSDYPLVLRHAKEQKILTDIHVAKDLSDEVLRFFQLKKGDFKAGDDKDKYVGVDDNWIYYNAIGPLTAIYTCTTDFLLYHTGDVWLEEGVDWIPKAVAYMTKHPKYKVANLTWNGKYEEARKESYKKRKGFYIAKQGFSDQQFLVRTSDFRQPIYSEIRADAAHFPRGDVFEKRVFSYMKNHGWERITYSKGSYTHV